VSPSGIEEYSKYVNIVKASRGSGSADGEFIKYFGIEDGQTARIRFLEQGDQLNYALAHGIKNSFGRFIDLICIDQKNEGTPCPACMSDNVNIRKRSPKGFLNVIWRGSDESEYIRGPIYKTNDKGFIEKDPITKKKVIVGFEDGVFLWKCSKSVWEMVLEKNRVYKGLMNRDFIVSRKGASKEDTKYAIEQAVIDGGPEPMTVADQNLAQNKFDVVKLTTPGTYEEMVAILSGQVSAGSGGPQPTFQREIPTQENVFNSGNPLRSSAFQR
jgi:hypothetical protein